MKFGKWINNQISYYDGLPIRVVVKETKQVTKQKEDEDGNLVDYTEEVTENLDTVITNPNMDTLLAQGYYPVKDIDKIGDDYLEDGTIYHYTKQAPTLSLKIEEKIAEIDNYDESSNVNWFYVGDVGMWVDVTLRNRLRGTLEAEKSKGNTTFEYWYNGIRYEFTIELWSAMLLEVEHYAYVCKCNTEQHKFEVKALTTIEEVDAYDITAGYPDKLHF